MRTRHVIIALLALALSLPLALRAQNQDKNKSEAERRLEDAQQELAEALDRLRQADEQEARSRLAEAIRELQQAQRSLGATRFDDFVVVPEGRGRGWMSVFSDDRPRIGVILGTEDNPATDSIGAELQAVTPGGPADQAGLQAGDIVTKANGQSLARAGRRGERPGEKLAGIVRGLKEGDTLRVEYRRDGANRSATVVPRVLGSQAYSFALSGDSGVAWLGELPRVHLPDLREMDFRPLGLLPRRWLNMELVTLDETLGKYFGTSKGVLVVRGPSEPTLNLESGDVILSIDGREPTSPAHALRIMRSYNSGESMQLQIMRMKRRMTVSATVPQQD